MVKCFSKGHGNCLYACSQIQQNCEFTNSVHASLDCIYICNNLSPCREEIRARASIRACAFVCMSDCSYLFGIARASRDLFIRNTEFIFAEAR